MDRSELRLLQQQKAHLKWARTPDKSAATAKARAESNSRFERQARELHPGGPESRIAEVAESLRRAHMIDMARRSAVARRKRREAAALEAEVAEDLANLAEGGEIA